MPGALTVDFEAPATADARRCLDQYVAELASRFGAGLDASVGASAPPDDLTPPKGQFALARLDGEPVGCGGLRRLDASTGEIKRVWTAPAARGRGVAGRIMQRLEDCAREWGMTKLRLDTNRALVEARALYVRRDYVEIARYNDNPHADHWFEKVLD